MRKAADGQVAGGDRKGTGAALGLQPKPVATDESKLLYSKENKLCSAGVAA